MWIACFIALCCLHQSQSLMCKSGIPRKLGENQGPNMNDGECKAPYYEDRCYVMFTDYDNDNLDAWTYGCISKGDLDKCDHTFDANGVTNNYCCCTTDLCNTKEFGDRCGGTTI